MQKKITSIYEGQKGKVVYLSREVSSLTQVNYLLSPREKERVSSLTQIRLVTTSSPLEDKG